MTAIREFSVKFHRHKRDFIKPSGKRFLRIAALLHCCFTLQTKRAGGGSLNLKMSRYMSYRIIPAGDSPENFGRTTLANVSAK